MHFFFYETSSNLKITKQKHVKSKNKNEINENTKKELPAGRAYVFSIQNI